MGKRHTDSTDYFYVSENTLYDIIIMDRSYYMFVQIHRTYNTKNEQGRQLWTSGDYDMLLWVHPW